MRLLVLPLLMLAACSSEPDEPGQITPDEAQALNDAAEMLDANSIDLNAVDEDEPSNEEDAR